jgi:hypothetical protein
VGVPRAEARRPPGDYGGFTSNPDVPATRTYPQSRPTGNRDLRATRPTVRRVAQGRERSATASPPFHDHAGRTDTRCRNEHLWRHPSGSGAVGGRRVAKARAPKGAYGRQRGLRPETKHQRRSKRRRGVGVCNEAASPFAKRPRRLQQVVRRPARGLPLRLPQATSR